MVTIGMNYMVLPGKEEVFERAFRQVVEAMKANPAHTGTKLYREVDTPQSFLLISEWNSRDAFDAFVKSEAFARVTQWGKENILAARPSHSVYQS